MISIIQNISSVSLTSSNECSAFRTLPIGMLSDIETNVNSCKNGYYWCQHSNGSRFRGSKNRLNLALKKV